MIPLTSAQRRRRAVIERGIAIAAPALDALLWAGDRLSRIVEGDDPAYDPPRPPAPDSLVRRGSAP
jgi:hypothetical protein